VASLQVDASLAGYRHLLRVMAIIDFPQGRSPEFPTLGLVVLG